MASLKTQQFRNMLTVPYLRENIDVLLIPIAILLWVYSIATASVEGITDFGLITALPLTFFVSVGVLTVSFLITLFRRKSKPLLIIQILLFILFLHLTPLLVEGARQRYAYSAYGVADFITRTGKISPEIIGYHNWPVFQIFVSTFQSLTGIDPDVVVRLSSPVLTELLFFFPLYLFFDLVLEDKQQKWLAIWIFYVADWVGRLYLSSQALGLIIYMAILPLVITLFIKRENMPKFQTSGRLTLVVLLLLFMALITGHALSSLVPIGVLVVLWVTRFFKRKTLLFCVVVMTIAWIVYGANNYFQANVADIVSNLLNVGNIFNQNFMGSVGGTQIAERILTSQAQRIYSGLIMLFATAGFLLSYKNKSITSTDKMTLAALVGVWVLSVALVYGGELFLRLWIFGLPMVVYFIMKLAKTKKGLAVLSIFLILFAPAMFFWTSYGAEAFDYVPPGELAGASFMYSTVGRGYVIGGIPWANYIGSYDRYKTISLNFYNSKDNLTETFSFMEFNDPRLTLRNESLYVISNHGQAEYYRRVYNDEDLFKHFDEKINERPGFSKIYSNPDFDMYLDSRIGELASLVKSK